MGVNRIKMNPRSGFCNGGFCDRRNMETTNQTQIVDVIVVGSGFAGLSVAIEAALGNAEVIVLEKMKAVGGNSIISDGGIAAWGTEEQQSEGIIDTADRMFEDMMRSGEGLNDPKIVRLICDHASEAYEWSKNFLGVKYMPRVNLFGGHSVPRCYTPEDISGVSTILRMKEKLASLSVPIHLGVSVASLIVDDRRRVVGVRVIDGYSMTSPQDGQYRDILARKGVVIASGGFGADVSFRQRLDPKLTSDILTTNKRSATSELLQACMDIGAKTANLDIIQCIPWTTPDENGYGKGALFGDYIVSSYGVLIDVKSGERFVDELGNRKIIADRFFEKKQGVVGIADENAVRDAGWDLSSVIQKKIVLTFDDLKTLADHYGIPKDALVKTMNDYNEGLRNGEDPCYHKTIQAWMNPIQTPPLYAMRMCVKTHYTCGGLVIDPSGRVLSIDDTIIEGLYAAGEVTGCTHGANRLGSCSVTECLVMGRIVGQTLASSTNESRK